MEEESNFESTYRAKLESLAENKKITEEQLSHFLRRWVQVISPSRDFGLEALGKLLPEIVIGASQDYINRMKVPYQATSLLLQIHYLTLKDRIFSRSRVSKEEGSD